MGHLDPGSKAYSHTTTNPSSKYFPRLYPTQNYAQTKLYVPTAPSKPKRKQTRYCNIQHPNTTCFFWATPKNPFYMFRQNSDIFQQHLCACFCRPWRPLVSAFRKPNPRWEQSLTRHRRCYVPWTWHLLWGGLGLKGWWRVLYKAKSWTIWQRVMIEHVFEDKFLFWNVLFQKVGVRWCLKIRIFEENGPFNKWHSCMNLCYVFVELEVNEVRREWVAVFTKPFSARH